MNRKSNITSIPELRFYTKNPSITDSGLETESSASSSSYISSEGLHNAVQHTYSAERPKTNFEFHCPKTAGRGMVNDQTTQSIIKPELVSNMNGKTTKIKLRGNKMSKSRLKYRPIIDSDLETKHSASSSSFIPHGQLHDTVQHIYSVEQANSITGSHYSTTECKGTMIAKISQSNGPSELTSNMNGKIHKTKLRGNEISRFRSKYQPITDSGLETEHSASNFSFIPHGQLQNTVHHTHTIDKPNHPKTAGRGMVIEQIAQSIKSSNGCLRYPNLPSQSVSLQSSYQLTVKGTGLANEQIPEHENLNLQLKNTILNFSNSNIEQYFKNLQQEKIKENKEENEKMWGKMLQSYQKRF